MSNLDILFTTVSNDGDKIHVATDKWSPAKKIPYDRDAFTDSIEAQVAAVKQYRGGAYEYVGWTILPIKSVWDIAHVFKRKV